MGDCLRKALELLARRPHFRRELEQKLERRGFSSTEIESALRRVSEQGWLDDLGHARNLVSGAFTRKGFGPRRMRHELRRRGVDEATADQAVDEQFSEPGTEIEQARRAIEKKLAAQPIDSERLGRFLDRRGFSTSVIVQLMREIRSE